MRKGKNGARRIAALICSVALAATLLPAQVLAADEATLPDQQVQADALEADGTGNSTENGTNVEPGTDTEAGTVKDNGSGQTDTETGAGEEAGSGTETDADTEGSTDKDTGTGAEAGTDTEGGTDTGGATDAETDTDTEGSTNAETNIDAEAGNDAKGNVENGSSTAPGSADESANSGNEGSTIGNNYTESDLVSRPAQLSVQEGDVAQIGDDKYATLGAAIEAAKTIDGPVAIQVLESCELDARIVADKDKSITITADPAANIVITDSNRKGMAASENSTITIENVTINTNGQFYVNGNNGKLLFHNVTLNMDGGMYQFNNDGYYCCAIASDYPALISFDGCEVDIKNYPSTGSAMRWNGGAGDSGYGIDILNTTFTSSNCYSGFVGTNDIRIENSTVNVQNHRGNGSNGSMYDIKNSRVSFISNGSHGISASKLNISDHSQVVSDSNGMYGVYVSNSFFMDGTSTLTVTNNSQKGDFAGLKLTSGVKDGKVEADAVVTITGNYCSGLSNNGKCVFENGVKLTITGNHNSQGKATGSHGGGVYNSGASANLTLPSDAVIYNNHAKTDGDDIFNDTASTIRFSAVGSNWMLDGNNQGIKESNDCTDAIDGWYDDSANARWNVHGTGTYHAELFTDFTDGMATVTSLKALKAAHAEAATLEPADITIYMGGDQGYDGVVNDQGTIEKTNSLPEPGYYITLPDKVNAALQDAGIVEGNAPVNLSDYITIHTIGAEGEHNWKLKQYGNTYSEAYNKYIYAIEPEDETAPLRLTFTQGENVYQQDEFDPSQVGALNNTYTMDVYSELVNAKRVFLQVTIPQKQDDGTSTTNTVYECVMNTEPGTLDVRYVTGDQDSVVTDIVTDVAEVADGSHAYAVAPSGTTYYINDSKIDVTSSAAPSLLFDDVVTDENTPGAQDYSDQLLERALTQIGTTMQQPLYQAKYLDLVDANNGNVWLTASNPVKIYWPYPAGTNQNTQFYLVHFEGMDRKMGTGEIGAAIDKANVQKVDVTNTEYGVCFEASSFSPFVLMWENPDQKVEEDEQPSQTPAPTAAPTPVPTATPAPTAVPTATPVGVIPQTGDTMPVGLLGGIALVAVVAFVVLLVLRKRKHDD